jgi:lipoprotein-releasing system permease protein
MNARSVPFGLFERMLAGRYLRARRQHGGVALISVISVLAIALAVSALIIIMSVMNGFRETLLSRILGVNGHVFIDVRDRSPNDIDRLMRLAAETPGVLHVTPLINAQALATTEDGLASGVLVRGIPREQLANLPIVADSIRPGGGLEGFEGIEAPTILVGERLAAHLGVSEGRAISILSSQGAMTPFGLTPRRKSFLIGGVFSVGMSEYDSTLVYMPLEQAQVLFSRPGPEVIELRVSDPDRTVPIMIDLRSRLGPDVMILDWRANSQGLADALTVERNVMRLIFMVVVAIAALNIVTGLILMVKLKSRDVAILRTMGATRGAIQRIFFMASASVGVIGLVTGLVLGVGFCIFIEPIQNFISMLTGFDVFPGTVYALESLPAKVEWGEVAIISIFTIALTFSATALTAWWASRLDPVEALRYE